MNPRSLACLLVLSVAAAHFTASAQDPPVERMLDTVVVSGQQPGLGLWKVTRDDGHVLWIMGTLSPLPKRMEWLPDQLQDAIAESQELLLAPSARLDVEGGWLRGVFLLPAAMKARNNPDGRTLKDVVPADLYARWLPLKQKYLGKERGVEKRRPLFAALRLYERGIERSGLEFKDVVTPVAKRAARKHDLVITEPKVEVTLDEPRDALRAFAQESLADIDCFRKTIERLETDLQGLRLRGNAWALGDVEGLYDARSSEQWRACTEAVTGNAVAQEHGLGNLRERVAATWLTAAEAAIAKNASSVALLPVGVLLGQDSPLIKLRERGYTVEAPR